MFSMLSEKKCMRSLIHSLSGRAISPIEGISIAKPDKNKDRITQLRRPLLHFPPTCTPIFSQNSTQCVILASHPYGKDDLLTTLYLWQHGI
jgi:hypothetical protein